MWFGYRLPVTMVSRAWLPGMPEICPPQAALHIILSNEGDTVYMSRLVTKPTKWHVRPANSDQLGHPPSLIRVFAVRMKKAQNQNQNCYWWHVQMTIIHQDLWWGKLVRSLATNWAHDEDTDQTGRMPRLTWVFAGRTCHFVGFVMRRLYIDRNESDREVKMKSFIHQSQGTDQEWTEMILMSNK